MINNRIKKPIEEAKNSDLIKSLKAHLATLVPIKKALDKLFEDESSYVKDKLYLVLDKIKNFDGDDFLKKIESLPGLTDKARENIKELLDIQAQIEKLQEKIKDEIDEKKDDIKKELEQLKEKLDKIKLLDAIKSNIDEIKNNIKNDPQPTILDNIMGIKEAINNFKKSTEKHNKDLINSLYEIRDGVLDLNATGLILKLNSSIFDVKEDFIKDLVLLVEKEELTAKLKALEDQFKKNLEKLDINKNLNAKIDEIEAQLDKLKEKVENSKLIKPIKTKIVAKIDEIKAEIEKQKNALKNNDIYKKGKEYVDEGKKILGLIKEDINDNDFIKLNDIIED